MTTNTMAYMGQGAAVAADKTKMVLADTVLLAAAVLAQRLMLETDVKLPEESPWRGSPTQLFCMLVDIAGGLAAPT